jgi:hypothetical protein
MGRLRQWELGALLVSLSLTLTACGGGSSDTGTRSSRESVVKEVNASIGVTPGDLASCIDSAPTQALTQALTDKRAQLQLMSRCVAEGKGTAEARDLLVQSSTAGLTARAPAFTACFRRSVGGLSGPQLSQVFLAYPSTQRLLPLVRWLVLNCLRNQAAFLEWRAAFAGRISQAMQRPIRGLPSGLSRPFQRCVVRQAEDLNRAQLDQLFAGLTVNDPANRFFRAAAMKCQAAGIKV